MNALASLLPICHRCVWRQAACAGRCACLADGRDIVDHAREATCPRDLFPATVAIGPSPTGAELWAELHTRPLAFRGDAAAELDYLLVGLPARVATVACDCGGHLQAFYARHPPRLTSPAAYALWTFDLHVSVNLRLRRPGLTLAAAADRHRWWQIIGRDVGLLPAVAA